MNWRTIRAFLFLVALTILIEALGQYVIAPLMHTTPPERFSDRQRHVESKSGQFALDYPGSWRFSEASQGDQNYPDIVARLEWNNFSSMMTIHKRAGLTSLTAVREWGERAAQSHLAYEAISYKPYLSRGMETGMLEYAFQVIQDFGLPNIRKRCIDNYRYYGDTGYKLTFCADEENVTISRSDFIAVVDSFSFRP